MFWLYQQDNRSHFNETRISYYDEIRYFMTRTFDLTKDLVSIFKLSLTFLVIFIIRSPRAIHDVR